MIGTNNANKDINNYLYLLEECSDNAISKNILKNIFMKYIKMINTNRFGYTKDMIDMSFNIFCNILKSNHRHMINILILQSVLVNDLKCADAMNNETKIVIGNNKTYYFTMEIKASPNYICDIVWHNEATEERFVLYSYMIKDMEFVNDNSTESYYTNRKSYWVSLLCNFKKNGENDVDISTTEFDITFHKNDSSYIVFYTEGSVYSPNVEEVSSLYYAINDLMGIDKLFNIFIDIGDITLV